MIKLGRGDILRPHHNFHFLPAFSKIFPLASGHFASTGGVGTGEGIAQPFELHAPAQPREWAEDHPGDTLVGSPWCWPSARYQRRFLFHEC